MQILECCGNFCATIGWVSTRPKYWPTIYWSQQIAFIFVFNWYVCTAEANWGLNINSLFASVIHTLARMFLFVHSKMNDVLSMMCIFDKQLKVYCIFLSFILSSIYNHFKSMIANFIWYSIFIQCILFNRYHAEDGQRWIDFIA